jgi:hypothetical protein
MRKKSEWEGPTWTHLTAGATAAERDDPARRRFVREAARWQRPSAGALGSEGTAREAARRRRTPLWASTHAGDGARGGAITSLRPP